MNCNWTVLKSVTEDAVVGEVWSLISGKWIVNLENIKQGSTISLILDVTQEAVSDIFQDQIEGPDGLCRR